MGYNPAPFIVASTQRKNRRVKGVTTAPTLSYCEEYDFYYSSYEEFSEKWKDAVKEKKGNEKNVKEGLI